MTINRNQLGNYKQIPIASIFCAALSFAPNTPNKTMATINMIMSFASDDLGANVLNDKLDMFDNLSWVF